MTFSLHLEPEIPVEGSGPQVEAVEGVEGVEAVEGVEGAEATTRQLEIAQLPRKLKPIINGKSSCLVQHF